MTSQEILTRFINFYKFHKHAETSNVSLVPGGDSTLLFVNSGMFPLVPYLSGEPHPAGKRLVNVQRSMRFDDLEEVGDYNHTTCFHMLGNWSLGDYFKEEQLNWVYEFMIEEIGLDPRRLFASVFEGDAYAPRDDVSIEILKKIFKKYEVEAGIGERVFTYGKEDNWWQRGDAIGELGGPDSEIFYYLGEGDPVGKNPADHDTDFLEIGNSVFMQFIRTENGWGELPQKNVDFGGGLERLALVSQGKKDIFRTDTFWPIIKKLQEMSGRKYIESEAEDTQHTLRSMRVLADHIRSSVLLAMDGVLPSNKDQGYALRRFIRRIVREGKKIGIEGYVTPNLVDTVGQMYGWLYPEILKKKTEIKVVFINEEDKFSKTLDRGRTRSEQRIDKEITIEHESAPKVAEVAFDLYQSVGYPGGMFFEDLIDKNVKFDRKEVEEIYNKLFREHQEKSRKGAETKFKGGLADHSEEVVKYHTATHLLHYALRQVLGEQVVQRGSNITGERLRFDFNNDEKLTEEQVEQVEKIVEDKVVSKIPVNFVMLSKEEAEKTGAVHAFNEKYGDKVKVYYIGETIEKAFSKEFCGGPHVENTKDLSPIEIYKQESIGKGVRRVYAKFS